MRDNVIDKFISDPVGRDTVEKEFKRILDDQERLRKHILKNGDDYIHLPLQLSRFIWNAKQQFNIKPDSRTDLSPVYVVERLDELCNELSVFPGFARMNENDKRFTREANENCTMLIKIYIRYMLCSK